MFDKENDWAALHLIILKIQISLIKTNQTSESINFGINKGRG